MIDTHGIVKTFGRLKALDGVDLHVQQGKVFALLGPNGAGKTTMVRVLSSLMRPDAGTATIAGHDVVRESRKTRSVISLTGQYAAVDELLTGEENLRMMARLRKLSRARARQRASELLEEFELVEARGRPVKNYSGGMKRRLDLALSLVTTPQVLFLDEPTTGLDPRSRLDLWAKVRNLARGGVTVLLTTQYLEEADNLADQVAVLDRGRVVALGTPEELKRLVPGGRIELAFGTEEDLRAAAARVPGLVEELRLSVPTDGSAGEVKRVLDALDGIELAELTVRKPSLDDVFLQLTGGRAA
ncbi:ATP-binding cassette domain-containing protein [Allorhizocola rhizosphaerae]|uniref:ATP-binding cassette domain-containing protein n=1 Tax=Allorhizocola rhizosphaerae TaxID=1872709 RepID=UPI000E3CAE20|nr:ATP-binding cassette domain-containing protein [Allorhizocola rhizosphaerae]